MPFTPYHFGPGLLIKALFRRVFSLWVFVLTQFFTDCETLYFILRQERPLHRFFHSYPGTFFMILFCAWLGRLTYHTSMRLWRRLRGSVMPVPHLSWPKAFVSAVIGAWSHVFLDSIMHSDVRPFAPFSNANPSLRLVPVETLHAFCFWSGLAGLFILTVLFILKRYKKA